MAEKKTRKRRLPKAETVTFVAEASGDLSIRCRFCDAVHSLKDAWTHRCATPATGSHLDGED